LKDKPKRRINLFAGPGAGKSASAANIFSQLKAKHYNIEIICEYVKLWAYQSIPVESFDQVFLLGQQIRQEDVVLRNGVNTVVTDSPLLMYPCYAKKYGFKGWRHLLGIVEEFEESYPSINIFLIRDKNVSYANEGRFHTLSSAIEMDKAIMETIHESEIPYKIFHIGDDDIIEYLKDQIDH